MSRRGVRKLPGFSYDPRRKEARFILYVPGSRGRARRKRVVFAESENDAVALYASFRAEIIAPRRTPKVEPTFSAFCAQYWERIKARLAAATVRSQESILRCHLLPFFGSDRLSKISAPAVDDFIVKLGNEGYAPSSINDAVRLLKTLLHHAVEREEIDRFPITKRVRHLTEPVLRLELSDIEREAFYRVFDDEIIFQKTLVSKATKTRAVIQSASFSVPRIFGGDLKPGSVAAGEYFDRFRASKPFFCVAVETGLRLGDLLDLRWSSIDLETGWVRVLTHKAAKEVTIPISENCAAALRECRARAVPSIYVFARPNGSSFSRTTVRDYFALAKCLAGITRRFRFHDLRHTFGCRLSSNGVPLQVIAAALGHSSVKMSERYARPSIDAMRLIRQALDGDMLNHHVGERSSPA